MRKNSKKYFYSIIILVLILAGVWLWREIYFPKNFGSEKQVVFQIEKGEGLANISSGLEKQGIIKSKYLFTALALLKGAQNKFQAGDYSLSPAMNVLEVLQKLVSGQIIKEKITIIEGWDLRDVAKLLKEKGFLKEQKDFFEIAGEPGKIEKQPNDFSNEFGFLKEKPKDVSLEGYLFPDTYYVNEQRTMNNEQRIGDNERKIEEIIVKMLMNFDKKLTADLREEIKKQGKTLHQVLTMASLLEKEVKSYRDKQIAAGILWKRLRSGWPLQVDATLTYLTGRGSGQLTKKDKKINSLYNTYKYYGLPPGPICNPGLDSIRAAVYYKDSPNWYYLTTPDGKTIFSRMLQQHNAARAKYLK